MREALRSSLGARKRRVIHPRRDVAELPRLCTPLADACAAALTRRFYGERVAVRLSFHTPDTDAITEAAVMGTVDPVGTPARRETASLASWALLERLRLALILYYHGACQESGPAWA